MDKNDCMLQLHELFFSKYNFAQTREDEDKNYKTSFRIDYAVSKQDSSKFRIKINTSIKNETESVILNLETIGIFSVDKEIDENNVSEHVIKVNTVAIMLPFIRSQISLLTTQPGMEPILLPPINVNALKASEDVVED